MYILFPHLQVYTLLFYYIRVFILCIDIQIYVHFKVLQKLVYFMSLECL